MSESAFAQHIVSSIRKELELLKNHNYLQPQAYNEILNLLPKDVSAPNRNMPSGAFPPQQAMNSPPPSSFGGNMPSSGNMPSPAHSQISNASSLPPPPSYNIVQEKSLGTAEALYDFHGDNPSTDLPIRRGDIIQLTEFVNNDWWKGTSNGKTGIFPSNYVKKIETTPMNEKRASGPPPPTQRDGYGYSPAPPAQNSYNNYSSPNNYTAPPPPSGQANSYATPPANNYAPPPIQNQVNSYAAPPPVQHVASTSSAPAAVEEQHESKVSSLGKKFAGNVANAATWGFGATIGSDIAHSIF